ncbi:DUF5133 domain-containing protein [Streptomyces lavendofoliae]|uniref:DUF5133 domain-containing protein n=1 Tax=Streptomyces lavendofoliae TaxID=67314 RepID=UPI00300EAA61
MLVPAARELREALARFADVRIALSYREVPAMRRELDRISRELCAMTGARTIDDALAIADTMLTRPPLRRPAEGTGATVDVATAA